MSALLWRVLQVFTLIKDDMSCRGIVKIRVSPFGHTN
jgi:hypothetical protein